jgi:RNA polymerase sigma-70 factor (ECF subfamily)
VADGAPDRPGPPDSRDPDERRDPRETALVRRARDGDSDAFGELVTMHQEAAFRVAHLLAGDPADAEEAAQEGFVRAWSSLGRFRDDAPFRPWLLAIVGNEARNRRRSRTRREGLLARASALVRRGHEDAPDLAVVLAEARAEVRSALAVLAPRERQVIACRYLLDLSEAETAAALDIPTGTVKSRLHRGLGRLRDELDPARREEGAA